MNKKNSPSVTSWLDKHVDTQDIMNKPIFWENNHPNAIGLGQSRNQLMYFRLN